MNNSQILDALQKRKKVLLEELDQVNNGISIFIKIPTGRNVKITKPEVIKKEEGYNLDASWIWKVCYIAKKLNNFTVAQVIAEMAKYEPLKSKKKDAFRECVDRTFWVVKARGHVIKINTVGKGIYKYNSKKK